MKINKITQDVSVAPQLIEADIAEIKALGFQSIICNRPDNEELNQCSYKLIQKQARNNGLEFRNLPVVNTAVSIKEISLFKKLLEELPSPILAYCRTGTRCATLWSLSQSDHRSKEEIIIKTKRAGYDMSNAVNRIDSNGEVS